MKLREVSALLGCLGLVSCSGGSGGGSKPSPDVGGQTSDAVVLPDVGAPDRAPPDAAIPDLAVLDVAVPDADLPDTGVPDLGLADASFPDLGAPDFFVPDAATPDTRVPDLAVPDLAIPDTGNSDTVVPDAAPDATPDTTGTGPLPRFVDKPDAGAAKPFLSCLAHLYGQTVAGVPLHPIDNVDVTNPGASGADVIVTAQLQSYSDLASIGLHVSANSTAGTGPIDLTFDLAALYAVSAPVTANATLQLTPAGSTALLDAHTRNIQILPKNTIFWSMQDSSGNAINTIPFIGVFVTPHDRAKAIDQLLKDAASYSRCNAMVGYQTPACMDAAAVSWSPSTMTTPPGYCATWNLPAKAGTVYDLTVQASCSSLCTSSNATFYVFTQSDWQGTKTSPIRTVSDLGSSTGSFLVPADDTYVLAACNPSSNFTDRNFTVTAAGNPTLTGVVDQMSAIFLALKARGMQYVNVPQDFFGAASQNVKFPVESLATASANCIDGTLVFASALESMAMRPGIVVVPGHAFVAVLASETADPCIAGNWIPIETVMVSSSTPAEAVKSDLANHMPSVTQVFADGCAGSASQSVNTVYDVRSLRAYGILPAPM